MKILTSIFFVVSLILYITAPKNYSHEFCLIEMCLYILISFFFLKHKIRRLGFFNFYVLFLVAVWAVNYIHPVFIYPDDELFPAYSFQYDTGSICSGLALAQLGISCFMHASLYCEQVGCSLTALKTKLVQPNITLSNVSVIACIYLIIYIFAIAQISHFEHLYPRLMKVLQALLIYNFLLNFKYRENIFQLLADNKKVLFTIAAFSLSLIMIGSRGGVIYVLLSVFTIYYLFYKRISSKYIFLFLSLGLFFMTILTFTRVSSVNLLTSSFVDVLDYGIDKIFSSDIWVIFLDWVVNTRNLYDAMNYPDIYGYLWGASYLPYIGVFIPFGGVFLCELLLGVSTSEIMTGQILSEWNGANYGLGTNMIGDLYMNFAEYGVIGGMFILGLLISWAENCKTVNQLFIYISLLVYSVTIPRASILGWIDLWAFLWIIRFFFMMLSFKVVKKVDFNSKQRNNENLYKNT